jgi:hypothetical protein
MMTSMEGSTERSTEGPITKSDIESKLRELRGDVAVSAAAARPIVLAAAAVAAVGVVAVVYLLGRRQGRRKSTVVEVRRI